MTDPVAASAPEWSPAPPHPIPAIAWAWLVVVVGVPAIVLGLIVLLLAGPLAALAALVLLLVGAAFWIGLQGRSALRSCGAEPTTPGSNPRIENLVAGIAADLGVDRPGIWRAGGDKPNAMICRAGGVALVVSGPAEERLTRTELEGVLTHLLLREKRGELWRGSLAAALGSAAGPAAPHVGALEDSATTALTRYPPGLASALAKCGPASGRFSVLWFCGEGPYQAPIEDRIAALNDL